MSRFLAPIDRLRPRALLATWAAYVALMLATPGRLDAAEAPTAKLPAPAVSQQAAIDDEPELTAELKAVSTSLGAAEALPSCCVEPDVWLVSTRSAPCCCNLTQGATRITYRHLVNGCWQLVDLPQFLAADDPTVCTVFLLPGNRADCGTAIEFGLLGARRIARQACGRKVRAVIWSWPADRSTLRTRPDVKIKTDRSDCEAWYLAWLVNQMGPEVHVGLVGYSLGARSIGGALQLLAGGRYDGRTLEVRHKDRMRMGVAMYAAAIECDWFRAGHPMDLALTQVDRILVTTNPSDTLLRFFPRQSRPNVDPALGFRGPCCIGELKCALTIRNVSGLVGGDHNWRPYLRTACINMWTAESVLGPCGVTPTPATPAPVPVAAQTAQTAASK